MSALHYLASLVILWSAGTSAKERSLRSQLDGTWKLVSTEQVLADGTRRPNPLYSPGDGAYLIYTDDGSMCAMFRSAEKMNAYCGVYELNEAQHYVSHNVEIKDLPDDARLRVRDIGDGVSRYISIDRDTLKLRTVEPRAGIKEDTQTWKRDD